MKRLFVYILAAAAVIAFAMVTASAEAVVEETDWAARQDACHEAAELLRELGAAEDGFVDDFYKRLMYISDSLSKGYMSYEDMNRTLKAENGIEVTGWE